MAFGTLTPGQSAYATVSPFDPAVGELWLRHPTLGDRQAFTLPTANGASGQARCDSIAVLLNSYLSDSGHDPDFITPSFTHAAPTNIWPFGAYSVVITRTRGSDPDPNCATSFADCGSGPRPSVQECLYTACGISNCQGSYVRMSKSYQTDLIFVTDADLIHYGSAVPWDLSLYLADRLRVLIEGRDALDRPVTSLYVEGLNNYGGDVNFALAGYLAGEEVCDVVTNCWNGHEVAHTADLTMARGPDRPDLICNTWVRVTNLSHVSQPSVVARVTDAGVSGYVEGTAGGVCTALKMTTACQQVSVRLSVP